MKRDPETWNEAYIFEKRTYLFDKRPTQMKRGLCIWKATYKWDPVTKLATTNSESSLSLCSGIMSRETCTIEKRHKHMKRDLRISKETYKWDPGSNHLSPCAQVPCQKRPVQLKRGTNIWKEAYVFKKRPINETPVTNPLSSCAQVPCQKRPIHVKKDPYIRKETCIHEKWPTNETHVTK